MASHLCSVANSLVNTNAENTINIITLGDNYLDIPFLRISSRLACSVTNGVGGILESCNKGNLNLRDRFWDLKNRLLM